MAEGTVLRETPGLRIVSGKPVNSCEIAQPRFTQKETELLDAVNKLALQDLSPAEIAFLVLENKERGRFLEMVDDFMDRVRSVPPYLPEKDRERVRGYVDAFLDKAAPYVKNRKDVREEIMRTVAGMGKLTPLVEDDGLEEIMVNGAKKPVYVFDTRYGSCRTSLSFDNNDEIEGIINKIAAAAGRQISRESPLLDARLPDGSRMNATVPPVSTGATLTIRKFRRTPFTILDIIERGTLSYELAAFLWLCADGLGVKPANVIIAGGSGCGKTTTLNTLSVFIPPRDRIVTIDRKSVV
jgi:flagellar protein FlaI